MNQPTDKQAMNATVDLRKASRREFLKRAAAVAAAAPLADAAAV